MDIGLAIHLASKMIVLITAISAFAIFLIVMIVSVAKSCKHKWKTLGTTPIKFNTQTFGFVSGHTGEIILKQCEVCKEKYAHATDGMNENWTIDFDFANRNYFGGKVKEIK